MHKSHPWRDVLFTDFGMLILLAMALFLLHMLINGQYGFHRDELATLGDARYLAWGYVAYPPVTPVIARLSLELFGPSLVGLRSFCALALAAAMVLTGLMARELGGQRLAQVVAALAVAIAPNALSEGNFFQYISFDYLWWVLITYLLIRLLKSEDPRWWLGIGAVIGLGMLTKYTMAFFTAGVVAGVVLTKTRRYLASSWLWGGVALALPLAPVNSPWWTVASDINDGFKESLGWPELTETVAGIYAALPAAEKAQTGILAGNYGAAGAINLYGPAYGLPEAISGVNSYWLRGFGDPPPQTLIVVGGTRSWATQLFKNCEIAGHVANRYGVKNEEVRLHPDIFVCRGLRESWPELWSRFQWFA